jgi:tetratricopeptide (TPR) repeat protein
MAVSNRFFVSFSSHDLKYVREIMAALKGQGLDFWDYSDIAESIELSEIIQERLIREIDQCTHIIAVLSSNSLDPAIGRFCRIEIEYAFKRCVSGNLTLLPVIIGKRDELKFDGIYKEFEQSLSQDFELTPESIVQLSAKICKAIGKQYLPPIIAHPNLPFREYFRKEIAGIDHSIKNHIDLMIILGEFNEYYRQESQNIHRALFLITYFIMSCEYRMMDYRPFYPWIVKAVCETELEMYDEAMLSYVKAQVIHPENQDVKGGMGTIYFRTGQYLKAADCFEQIIRNNSTENISNARINLIITKQAMGVTVGPEEERFLFDVNIETYADDLKTQILNAQAIQFKIKKDYLALEMHCRAVIGKDLHDTITIRLLQGSFISRGMVDSAKQVIRRAIEEAEYNPRLKKDILMTFL